MGMCTAFLFEPKLKTTACIPLYPFCAYPYPCELQLTRHTYFLQINSESSPYEAEDDFFTRSQVDSTLAPKRSQSSQNDVNGRPRGQSESFVNLKA